MIWILSLIFLAGVGQTHAVSTPSESAILERGVTWDQFLEAVRAQRPRWIDNAARSQPPDALVQRLARAGGGLTFLIVAEDWCVDSVNTVPYVVALAHAARVDVRIVNRSVGAPLVSAHRAADGRRVTPIVVLLRDGRDAGAWIERPEPLQQLFRTMDDNAGNAHRFAQRQTWYDHDRGRTAMAEIVDLAERTFTR